MNKFKSIIIANAFLLAFGGVCYSSPFEDVPTNHWAYEAINELSEAGVITCIEGNKYIGEKPIDRLTMASYLANALSNIENKYGKDYSKLGENNISNIQRLAMEYADELAKMSVKFNGLDNDLKQIKEDVANLKWDVAEIKKEIESQPRERVSIGGDYLTRITDLHYEDGYSGKHQVAGLLRFKFAMNIDKDVKAVARWRLMNGVGDSGTWRGKNHTTGIMDLAFLQINNKLGGNILLGRTFEATGHSLLINQYVDVARYITNSGKNSFIINSYFKKKADNDNNQIWNLGFKHKEAKYNYYVNLYGQTGSAGYDMINKTPDANVKDSKRYDVEAGVHGLLGNSGKYSYDISAVHTDLKQNFNDGEKVDDSGNIIYAALNWDTKEEVAAKVSYYMADKEAHGGLLLGGDRRLAMGPESPLEDITRLDNLMYTMDHFLIDGDTHNFSDTKVQIEYRPMNSSKNYFRVAYDFLRELKDTVNGIDNSNPLGTASGKADVLTVEYRYKLGKNTNWKTGYSKFTHKGLADRITGQDAGHGTTGRDKDYGLLWSEIYTSF